MKLIALKGAEREAELKRFESLDDRDTVRTLIEVASRQGGIRGSWAYPFHVRMACERAAERLYALLAADGSKKGSPEHPTTLWLNP